MKNLLKTSLLAVILFISSSVYAYDEAFSLKVKSNNQKFIVFYIKEAQDVQLTIYSADDEVLYEQEIHALKPVAKTYNLEAFPDGNYVIKLETDLKITEYKIKIADGKTIVEEPLISEKVKPVITKDKDVITLNIENTGQNPVEIKIVGENNEELYSKVFTDNSKLSKKFNIGQTDAKELTFIVRVKHQEFVQTLALN